MKKIETLPILIQTTGNQVELANYIADYFIDRRSFELFKNTIEQLVINESIKSCKNWLHIFKNTDPNETNNHNTPQRQAG